MVGISEPEFRKDFSNVKSLVARKLNHEMIGALRHALILAERGEIDFLVMAYHDPITQCMSTCWRHNGTTTATKYQIVGHIQEIQQEILEME